MPILSHGLGFWPEVIVDQHFSERERLERLERAVRDHPHLVGVGIDEATAVVVENGRRFRVMGEGTVTVFRTGGKDDCGDGLERLVLYPGQLYRIGETVSGRDTGHE